MVIAFNDANDEFIIVGGDGGGELTPTVCPFNRLAAAAAAAAAADVFIEKPLFLALLVPVVVVFADGGAPEITSIPLSLIESSLFVVEVVVVVVPLLLNTMFTLERPFILSKRAERRNDSIESTFTST